MCIISYDVQLINVLFVMTQITEIMTILMLLSTLLLQMLWVCSIYLEAICIVPQLIILQRYREVENLTGHYVFLLGIYRALYILNWVYRSYHEEFYQHNWVVYLCGFVQTCLYLDFFYYYFLSKYRGGKFALPN